MRFFFFVCFFCALPLRFHSFWRFLFSGILLFDLFIYCAMRKQFEWLWVLCSSIQVNTNLGWQSFTMNELSGTDWVYGAVQKEIPCKFIDFVHRKSNKLKIHRIKCRLPGYM